MPSSSTVREWQLQPVLGPRGGVVAKVLVPATEPVIVVPERPRGRQKSNSLRGKEFRAKKKQYEKILQDRIQNLRKEVEDLKCLHELKQETTLVRKDNTQGSIARLTCAYINLFQSGTPVGYHGGNKRQASDPAFDLAVKQEAFLHQAMDEQCEVIDADGLMDQWQRYTAYHASLNISIRFMDVSGTEDKPVVRVGLDLAVTYSRATFENVFPHVAKDEEFVKKHTGRVVVYKGLNTFTFSPEGRILVYDSDVDFVKPLLASGMSLEDVSKLMQQALIAEQYRLGESDHTDTEYESEPEPVESEEQRYEGTGTNPGIAPTRGGDTDDTEDDVQADPASAPPRNERLDLEFILS